MTQRKPEYYRARIALIQELLSKMDTNRHEKNNDRVVLRNGMFPKDYDEQAMVEAMLTKRTFSNSPISFQEKTRFSTWFAMHPQKVAGEQKVTTSHEFPITIKGTKQDILRTIKLITPLKFKLEIKKKQAKAKLKMMQL